jgi:hypothetical protein
MPSTIPEIPFAKSTNQRAVAKIAVFAYNRKTGRPVLQSGVVPVTSTARNSWFFGAGPFQRGTVYEGTNFAGNQVGVPIIGSRRQNRDASDEAPIATGTVYRDGFEEVDAQPGSGGGSAVPLVAATPIAANSAAALPPQPARPPVSATPAASTPAPAPALPPTPPPLPAGPSGTSGMAPIGGVSTGSSAQLNSANAQWMVDLWRIREANGAGGGAN